MDPIVIYDVEKILQEKGLTHSEAVALFYKRVIEDGNLDFLEKKE